MTPSDVVDPSRCPLCGQGNQCAIEVERITGLKQPACWCTRSAISADVLARIPDTARNKACICAACARPLQ